MNTEQRKKWLDDQMKQLREMCQLVFIPFTCEWDSNSERNTHDV